MVNRNLLFDRILLETATKRMVQLCFFAKSLTESQKQSQPKLL